MFERFFNYSNELMCIASLDGKFLHINDAFVDLLGYSREQLLTRPFLDLVHPEDIEKTQLEMRHIGAGQNTVNFENRYRCSDGSTKFISWKSTLDPESNLIFATARDITTEKLAINQYAQLYKMVTDNIIYVKTDVKGVITEVNDMFCEISGYDRNELIGKTHKVVNSGVHSHDFFKTMWKAIRSGQVWKDAITNRRKDGSQYVVESIVAPMLDIDGKVEAYIALRQDITERIQYQQLSKKNLDILNETGEIAKVGGWELEIETGQLFWTDETFKILDVQKRNGAQPVLEEGLQLFTDEHKPIIDKAVNDAAQNGTPYALELQAMTPKGEVKWVYTNGKANYRDRKIYSLSGTIQDIHEKKLAELRYKEERQRSIQSAKFAALGELAASVAHEINNPLGIISGYAELIKYQGRVDEQKLEAIMKSCDRIAHIVKNLKRFSRSDSSPTKTKVDLAEIVVDAISLTQPRATRHLADIDFFSNREFYVNGNHIELEQVVINLINNAVDAVAKKPLKQISLELKDTDSDIQLRVIDTGGGIDDGLKIRMFEPFVTTKTENMGTGLGLSVVRGIVEDHDAKIEVENIEQGAEFVIKFPKYIEEANHG